jgi:hypothetical protein
MPLRSVPRVPFAARCAHRSSPPWATKSRSLRELFDPALRMGRRSPRSSRSTPAIPGTVYTDHAAPGPHRPRRARSTPTTPGPVHSAGRGAPSLTRSAPSAPGGRKSRPRAGNCVMGSARNSPYTKQQGRKTALAGGRPVPPGAPHRGHMRRVREGGFHVDSIEQRSFTISHPDRRRGPARADRGRQPGGREPALLGAARRDPRGAASGRRPRAG